MFSIMNCSIRTAQFDTQTECCAPAFDGIEYWPETPANTTVRLVCRIFKDIIYTNERYVYRHCFPNASWEPAVDYSDCIPTEAEISFSAPMVRKLYTILWIGYPLSLFFCLLALCIFCRYSNLWCLRNMIHTNMILCFTLHNSLWIAYSLIYHEFQLTTNTFMKCIVPLVLLRYFICAAFCWMFVEGFYIFINLLYSLHSPKINFFSCSLVGWVFPMIPVALAVFVVANDLTSDRCLEFTHASVDYVIIIPVILLMMANFCFLCKILTAVTSKLRLTLNNKFQFYSKAIRALLVLCPLLGINFLLSLYHPLRPKWLNATVHYVSTVLTASQGGLVAIFFCFRNKEVQDCLGRSFTSLKLSLKLREERKRRGSSRRSEHSQITLLSVPPSPTGQTVT